MAASVERLALALSRSTPAHKRRASSAGREGTTEEHNGVGALLEHRTETGARCVAVDGERLLEVRKMENECRGQGLFESVCCRSLVSPHERVLPKQLCERHDDGPKILDEAAVVARQAEEVAEAAR